MEKTAFVTVGTTQFDELIEYVTKRETLVILQRHGYSKLLMQIGNGEEPIKDTIPGLVIEWYRLKPSIKEDFSRASLVISHAGAGSCIEALEANKMLIAVVNEKLMDNHQDELADALSKRRYCYSCYPKTLYSTIACLNPSDLVKYEPGNSNALSDYLSKLFD